MWHDSVCNTVQEPTVTSTIVAKKPTTWGESGFPSEFLAEDWSDKQIEKSMETIQRIMQKTVDHRRYQDRVLQLYHESHSPHDFQDDPRTVMRSLSQHFNRKEMSQVYSVLVERGLASPRHGK